MRAGCRSTKGTFSVVTAAQLLHVVDAATRREIIGEAHRSPAPGQTPSDCHADVSEAHHAIVYAPLAAAAGSSRPAARSAPLDPRLELVETGFTIVRTSSCTSAAATPRFAS